MSNIKEIPEMKHIRCMYFCSTYYLPPNKFIVVCLLTHISFSLLVLRSLLP